MAAVAVVIELNGRDGYDDTQTSETWQNSIMLSILTKDYKQLIQQGSGKRLLHYNQVDLSEKCMPLMPAIQQSANIDLKAKTTATGIVNEQGITFQISSRTERKNQTLRYGL